MLVRPGSAAQITSLKVRNYRALRSVELRDLTSMTVLVGPNGSGKSTVFDVFAFLSECFESGLRRAWDRRGRAKELVTRGASGPVSIEIKYREAGFPIITYFVSLAEENGVPIVEEEWLRWTRKPGRGGRPFKFLEYKRGQGSAVSGEQPDEEGSRVERPLDSPDLLAVNALGQFSEHPRVASLRRYVTSWYVSYLSAEAARFQPEAGPQERLNRSGDNLANVVQYLAERHPERLESIFQQLRLRVPRIEKVLAESMADGRLLLQIKDAPFASPVLAKFASDGTLKMLAYLVLLHDPKPPSFIGVEEPENFLHPKLLRGLAEECRVASERSQMLVTTHSPEFLDGLFAREVRVLSRNPDGYTEAVPASLIPRIPEFIEAGASLGELWLEGRFGPADPIASSYVG
jgi:predicted ATPase